MTTRAAEEIIAQLDQYIEAMENAGKKPTTLHLTERQWKKLESEFGKNQERDWKPRYRGIPIQTHRR